MGVPAFYRWLSEKYPKIVQDVLEERVKLVSADGTTRMPFDATRPNPSGLETDNLYIDMNGIIHPCSHPENGPQPSSEEEMFENVCHYVDRLVRAVRPRRLLYLAIDGVAPRAKMNQQRSRRFRSAQEAREHAALEEHVRDELVRQGQHVPPIQKRWDSNVITPGTQFMLNLSEFLRFYIRKRISTDGAWQTMRVIFSDASIPGEGEHKIMSHVRLQRSQPGHSPNLVHVLHGLDADLIMLALATHEVHFYILREVVTFGRHSVEKLEQRQLESGFRDAQRRMDEEAGESAMRLPENQHKPLQRVSIPILREYLASEFASCCTPGRLPFAASLERMIDDIVFLCFFVGNDFLPHLPSLDIRDGALDFLFNVYKRILPTLGDYITNHGGQVNLSHVDVILAEVGAIEDHVFAMKHENQKREERRKQEARERARMQRGRNPEAPPPPPVVSRAPNHQAMGRAARILERQTRAEADKKEKGVASTAVALQRGHLAKENARKDLKAKKMVAEANAKAALELKKSLMVNGDERPAAEDMPVKHATDKGKTEESHGAKRKLDSDDVIPEVNDGDAAAMVVEQEVDSSQVVEGIVEAEVVDAEDDEDDDEVGEDDEAEVEEPELPKEIDPAVAAEFKTRVKDMMQKKLDVYAKVVDDKVRLHEAGWKDRYYSDKCKADDVAAHGGREHLFRSYVMGLCWVMKYYYDGCASWKWYYPFHYAPFASDLRNIERFRDDCDSFELNEPFRPVEQLMAVLPSDSSHAIPKALRWLMTDEESPIIDFYPKDVPVDPNGKAMPWLWVVLLPFIDEERLLAALKPTMSQWSKKELLCNARGMDDGYLYVHTSHPMMKKLGDIVRSEKSSDNKKTRLTDMAAYDCHSFFGAVRMPLSNEVYPVEGEVTISPPSSASAIARVSSDCVFAEPIEINASVCVAFSEPAKLSHKSVILPGTKLPRAVLSAEDRRIRRPRLNRGGGTIANMGVTSGRSYESGYGSMNISSYERELAARTGRAGQMYQAGTRAWGAMEPTPKRVRQNGPVQQPGYPSNPFNQSLQQQAQVYPSQVGTRPPWQNANGQLSQQPYQLNPSYQQGYQTRPQYPQQQQGSYSSQQGGAYQQQHGGGNYQQAHLPQQRPPPPPPPSQGGHSYSFQSYNRSAPPPGQWNQYQGGGRPFNQQGHAGQPPSQVNSNVMSSLRSQLASTLQRNRGNRRGQNH